MTNMDPIVLVLGFALLALIPTILVVSTCFLKISVVVMLVRNALGVQQIPPNIAIYGLSLILTVYVMAPIGNRIYDAAMATPGGLRSAEQLVANVRRAAEPLRGFLDRNTKPEHRDFFMRTATRTWGAEAAADLKRTDFVVLMPSFLVSELTSAFQMGFLLYLPFVVIDLIISNILLAMGMMMVSPVTISLPLKLFLFVAVDGWTRLIEGLILTYA